MSRKARPGHRRASQVRSLSSVGLFLGVVLGCGSPGEEAMDREAAAQARPASLGPADGRDLPATDLDRVAVGTEAPDFSLLSLAGDTVTLSAFRGSRNVVLVFYRGHW